MESIKTSDIPGWFCIKNYNDAANLTAFDWYNQLLPRYSIYNQVSDFNAFNEVVDEDKQLSDYKDFMSGSALSAYEDIKQTGLLESTNNIFPSHRIFNNISPLSIGDFLDIEDETKDMVIKKELKRLISNQERQQENQILDVEPDLKTQRLKKTPLNDVLEYYHNEIININLAASDEIILSDFRDWLKGIRNKYKNTIHQKKDFKQKDFDRWSSNSILPFLDLTIWSRMELKSITNNAMGKTIFPNEFDIDLSERVRNTVKPLALSLITHESLVILGSQIIRSKNNTE